MNFFAALFILISPLFVQAASHEHKIAKSEPISGKNKCQKSVKGHSRQEVIYNSLHRSKLTSAKRHQIKLEWELSNLDIQSLELITEDTATEVYKVRLKNGQLAIWKPEPKYWIFKDPSNSHNFNLSREVIVYEISKRLGLFNIPVTVERKWNNQKGSLQAFVNKDSTDYSIKSLEELRLIDWFVGQFDRAPLCDGNCLRYKGIAVGYDNGFLLQVDQSFKIQQLNELDISHIENSVKQALNKELNIEQLKDLLKDRLNESEIEYIINSHHLLSQKLR